MSPGGLEAEFLSPSVRGCSSATTGLHLARVLASRGADLPQFEEKFPTGALATLVVHSES
jgi:hypothetical protein